MILFNKNDKQVEVGLDRYAELLNGHRTATNAMNGVGVTLRNTISVSPKTAIILELK